MYRQEERDDFAKETEKEQLERKLVESWIM